MLIIGHSCLRLVIAALAIVVGALFEEGISRTILGVSPDDTAQ